MHASRKVRPVVFAVVFLVSSLGISWLQTWYWLQTYFVGGLPAENFLGFLALSILSVPAHATIGLLLRKRKLGGEKVGWLSRYCWTVFGYNVFVLVLNSNGFHPAGLSQW